MCDGAVFIGVKEPSASPVVTKRGTSPPVGGGRSKLLNTGDFRLGHREGVTTGAAAPAVSLPRVPPPYSFLQLFKKLHELHAGPREAHTRTV